MSLYSQDILNLGPLPTAEELGVTPHEDQVLVEPVRVLERCERKVGSLWIPSNDKRDTAEDMEFLWLGRVVSVGPGDKLIEGEWQIEGWRKRSFRPLYAAPGGRVPCSLIPGHLVLYERRPWAEIERNGKSYVMLHEEQHVRAKLYPETLWRGETSTAIVPIADTIVVKQAEPYEKIGVLFVPATADGEEYLRGEVLAVGPGKVTKSGQRRPLDVRVGDKIAFPKLPRRGSRVYFDDQEFVLLAEEDVYGVIQEQAA